MTVFDSQAAKSNAITRIDGVLVERVRQIEQEAQQAREFAREYADHLAAGGDPTDYPQAEKDRDWRTQSQLVSSFLGLQVVYDEWNLGRVLPNPQRPFRNASAWRVGEAFIASIGTPITYADLVAVYHAGNMRSTKVQSEQIAKIAFEFERFYNPDRDDREYGESGLVARKTKVAGKTAYLVRERRDDDRKPDPEGRGDWRGYYSARDLPEERTS